MFLPYSLPMLITCRQDVGENAGRLKLNVDVSHDSQTNRKMTPARDSRQFLRLPCRELDEITWLGSSNGHLRGTPGAIGKHLLA